MVTFPNVDFTISDIPLRRVIRRGSLRHNGRFASRKMNRTIPWESSNEHAFLVLAELDADVTAIYAQALDLRSNDGPEQKRHIPDLVVIRTGRVEVHEVKPDDRANTDEIRMTTAWAERHCRNRGATYGVALESVLKAQPFFKTATAILRRLHDRVGQDLALGSAGESSPGRRAT